MINLKGIFVSRSNDSSTNVILTRKCPFCGESHSITVNESAYRKGLNAYNAGSLIQNAFPTFTANEREFLISGMCPKCWESM